ncbi:MAG: HDOD domain-containing protein [Deltaproteobacteria bacterium]|nr:HDOD domain-containing protein [Deltaproteobacteria bacterium]
MKRILFVDDEPRVLEGLQNLLRKERNRWEMVFAPGGAEGLALLEEKGFDVVVSDMRMPGMDGATFLTEVQRRYPRAARIVLSGQTDQASAGRVVAVAHQFLSKPCDSAALRKVIERACALQDLLHDEALQAVVGELGQLPSLPGVYLQLGRILDSPEASVTQMAQIVEQDAALCAKILQLVNSAFFGLAQKCLSVERAISLLGTSLLRNLVLWNAAGQGIERLPATLREDILARQAHAILAARLTARLAKGQPFAEAAFLAASLANLGWLVLATHQTSQAESLRASAAESGRPLHQLERELRGVTHAEVGAYLLGLWGFPSAVVESVAFHHEPGRIGHETFDSLAAVHVGYALAADAMDARARTAEHPTALIADGTLDEAYLERAGVLDQLPEWRRLAEQEAARMTGG